MEVYQVRRTKENRGSDTSTSVCDLVLYEDASAMCLKTRHAALAPSSCLFQKRGDSLLVVLG